MYIAYKEASETKYWLELLYETEYISSIQFDELSKENLELLRLLSSITKNSTK